MRKKDWFKHKNASEIVTIYLTALLSGWKNIYTADYQTLTVDAVLKFQQVVLKKCTKKQLIRTKTSCFFLNKN